MPAKKKR